VDKLFHVNETQILATVHSLDPTNDPLSCSFHLELAVFVSVNSTSNPTNEQRERATMDLVYAATKERTLMIEANSEAHMIEALHGF
jgi:polyribonucleotide nucleotidyltransferase